MILNINDFYFDTNTSILFFDKESYINSIDDDIVNNIKNKFIDKRKDAFNKKIINTLNIIPSMKCDGRCLYCYNEKSNNTIKNDLTVDVLIQTLNKLEKLGYILDIKTVRMYGGEPFKCLHLFEILSYLQHRYNGVIFYISTGLFIDTARFNDILIKFKSIKNLTIGIGVDLGTYPETRVGNITKTELINRCLLLYNNNYNIVFVNTITNNTYIDIMFDEINHLLKLCPNAKFRIAIACDKKLTVSLKDIDYLYDTMLKNYKCNKSITFNVFPYLDVIYSPKIYKISDNMFYFSYNSYYCGIYKDMIGIRSDGEIIRCHMDIDNNNTSINDFKFKNDLLNNIECEKCNYFMICRGGCLYRKRITDNYKENDKNIYCEWIKKSFELSLHKLSYQLNIHSYLNNNSIKI